MPAHSHNSYALCTILLDIQYRGMLLLQAAPVISPCMSSLQSHPQHKPTPCAGTCPAGLQDKCWQEMAVLKDGVMSLCVRQRTAGVLQAGAGVHKCGAGGQQLCGMQRLLTSRGTTSDLLLFLISFRHTTTALKQLAHHTLTWTQTHTKHTDTDTDAHQTQPSMCGKHTPHVAPVLTHAHHICLQQHVALQEGMQACLSPP
jgi:hypothetical protein